MPAFTANDYNRRNIRTVISVLAFILLNTFLYQKALADTTQIIYRVDIHQEIDPSSARILNRAIEEAEAQNAKYLLLDLDTYGGLVNSADEMRTALLKTDLITLVYIRNNAASAGALISIACDSIYMSPGSTIGAASVVYQDGKLAPDKMQSYMKGKMEATAKATGRNPLYAIAMVGSDTTLPGIIDSGRVLTFDVSDAIKYGYSNAEANSLEDVYPMLNLSDYKVIEHKISPLESIINLLVKPAVSGILLLIIVGGIYFELQTPGVGFPIAASIIAAALYFAPLYLEDLAAAWEIVIFIVGVVLIAVEIFVIPGFGVAGIAGISLTVAGLSLALIRNVKFDFTMVPSEEIYGALMLVLGTSSLGLIGFFLLTDRIASLPFIKRAALAKQEDKDSGYTIDTKENEGVVGKVGVTDSTLRPAGRIVIDGEPFDAQADSEFIEKGVEVKVLKAQGAYLIVERIKKS